MENILPELEDEVTAEGFNLWLKHARPGDRFEYHRGFLALDRERVVNLPQHGVFAHVYYEPMHSVGLAAWRAQEQGRVDLVQKRRYRGVYSYYAVKRKGRTAVTRRYENGKE